MLISKERTAVIKLIGNGSPEDVNDRLNELHQWNQSKTDEFLWSEFFDSLSKSEMDVMFKHCLKQIEASIPGDDEEEVGEQVTLASKMCVLNNITMVLLATLKDKMKGAVYGLNKSFQSCCEHLIDTILRLETDCPLQLTIAKLCERYWVINLPNKTFMIPNFLPYVLITCLNTSTRAHVHRLYVVREAFTYVDMEDESCESLKLYLLKCAMHPTFLKLQDGRKFLAYAFTLHPQFIIDLHNVFKNQIPNATKTVIDSYAEIYFKAWKELDGQPLLDFENNCIQDIMGHAVHASSPSLFKSLYRILESFHTEKRLPAIENLLLRLYEPILWRSLKAANPIVRRNAASLFVSVFPLQDADARNAEADALLQKQFDCLNSLLFDKDKDVRVVAVEGVCRILGVYWELIPFAVTKQLLTKLSSDLAHDASNTNVRAAVFRGLSFVLDNHLSHKLLKVLLPSLAPLIHDKSEKVRCAFIDLLIQVKSIKDIHFYEIVEPEHLLERLSLDSKSGSSSQVAQKMTQLLLNSYFPRGGGVSVNKLLNRCIHFIQRKPKASEVFYKNVHVHVGTGAVVKLISVLHRGLQCALKNEGSISEEISDDNDDDDDDDSEEEELLELDDGGKANTKGGKRNRNGSKKSKQKTQQQRNLSAGDLPLMSAMLKTMAELWSSIKVKLLEPARKEALDHLCKTLGSGELQILLDKFGHHPSCCTSILRMASMMPATMVKSIQDSLLPQLLDLPGDAIPVKYTHMLRAMFSWGREDEIVHLIIESIDTVIGSSTTSATTATTATGNKKSKKKRFYTTTPDVMKTATIGCRGNPIVTPSLAIGFLNVLLSFDIDKARTRVLEDATLTCQLLSSLMNVLPLMQRVLSLSGGSRTSSSSSSSSGGRTSSSSSSSTSTSGMNVDTLMIIFRSYISLSIHMEGNAVQGGNYDDFSIPMGIVDLTTWVTTFVQPVLERLGEIKPANKASSDNRSNGVAEMTQLSPPRTRVRKRSGSQHTPTTTHSTTEIEEQSIQLAKGVMWNLLLYLSEIVYLGGMANLDCVSVFLDWVVKYLTSISTSSTPSTSIMHQSLTAHVLRIVVAMCKQNWPVRDFMDTIHGRDNDDDANTTTSTTNYLYSMEMRYLKPLLESTNTSSSDTVFVAIKELLKLDNKEIEQMFDLVGTRNGGYTSVESRSFLSKLILPCLVGEEVVIPEPATLSSRLPSVNISLPTTNQQLMKIIQSENQINERAIYSLIVDVIENPELIRNNLFATTATNNTIQNDLNGGDEVRMDSSLSLRLSYYYKSCIKKLNVASVLLDSLDSVSDPMQLTYLNDGMKEVISIFDRYLSSSSSSSSDGVNKNSSNSVDVTVKAMYDAMLSFEKKLLSRGFDTVVNE